MSRLVSYDPKKDVPAPRSGARGFTATSGSVYFEPNTPTPISAELLQEIQQDPTFKALMKAGAITVVEDPQPPETPKSQPQDRAFDLPVLETEMTPVTDQKIQKTKV
jgi:hypothetical protein